MVVVGVESDDELPAIGPEGGGCRGRFLDVVGVDIITAADVGVVDDEGTLVISGLDSSSAPK